MKHLPIGISTLRFLIEDDMVYIDKTRYAYELIKTKGRFFLSRPRRFGKSLFVDTLKEIFEANRELFKGLYIHDKWDWDKKYPVIKIDFAGGVIKNSNDLADKLNAMLNFYQDYYEISCEENGAANVFNELIGKISKKFQSGVVILVDEYDGPLLDNIDAPETAAVVREGLKSFYSVIKQQDSNIQFVFLTGVSKSSKVSIFSGINNLNDITIDPQYSSICGYTQKDIESSFKEHLEGVDYTKLKEWYNGYNFLGEPVYNPFDILLFIDKEKQYRNYWFDTGTPTFLVKLFEKNSYFLPDLDNITAGEELLSSFEVGEIEPVTLLFQSGYLTIGTVTEKMNQFVYRLKFPNKEVRQAFNNSLFSTYTKIVENRTRYQEAAYDALASGNLSDLESAITRLFAGIPYRNFTNNNLVNYEGYYASVLYAFFSAINCDIIAEDLSNHGQADMTVKLENYIYVMEIKVQESVDLLQVSYNEALAQIQKRGYSNKYQGIKNLKVFEVGMIFSKEKRNLVAFGYAGPVSKD